MVNFKDLSHIFRRLGVNLKIYDESFVGFK
jgi:hypothetical protein